MLILWVTLRKSTRSALRLARLSPTLLFMRKRKVLCLTSHRLSRRLILRKTRSTSEDQRYHRHIHGLGSLVPESRWWLTQLLTVKTAPPARIHLQPGPRSRLSLSWIKYSTPRLSRTLFRGSQGFSKSFFYLLYRSKRLSEYKGLSSRRRTLIRKNIEIVFQPMEMIRAEDYA